MMKYLVMIWLLAGTLLVSGCSTVDGFRTDVADGVEWVGEKIRPESEEENDG